MKTLASLARWEKCIRRNQLLKVRILFFKALIFRFSHVTSFITICFLHFLHFNSLSRIIFLLPKIHILEFLLKLFLCGRSLMHEMYLAFVLDSFVDMEF